MRLTRGLINAAAVAVAAVGMLLTAPWAHAGTTSINTSGGDGANSSLLDVLKGIYGSTSDAIGQTTLTFTNAILRRVQDNGESSSADLNLHTGTGGGSAGTTDDRTWKDGISNFKVEAKYAGNSQEFGYYTTGGGYVALITTATAGETATGGPISGSVFQWAMKTSGLNSTTHYSDNGTAFDHMVTWEVTYTAGSKTGQKVWIVAWEDQTPGDTDYQDLVVEITAVPLPAAAWSGLAMLAGLAVFGWVRRRNGATLA